MFSYSLYDRQALIRRDNTLVNKVLQSPDSLILIWFEGKLITDKEGSVFFSYAKISRIADCFGEFIYLGKHASKAYFTCQLTHWHDYFKNFELLGLRPASLILGELHLGLLYHAQGLLNWHNNHPYCCKCGSATAMTHSGHERKCLNVECNKSHYPAIDPAVIFAVINNSGPESKILLARQPGWDKFRHSVLAGYVEPGETLEETVKREALEETGLEVKNIFYAGSQPWPFPGQIMLGFNCETRQWDINLFDQELESANWFSASEIESAVFSERLKMPFRASISWQLINQWFLQQTGYSLPEESRIS